MARIRALDGLRGIAAATVLARHASNVANLPIHPGADWAVMMFFVLSGFALALPWADGRPQAEGIFLLRRICRLWPPIIVAVFVSAALYNSLSPATTVNVWWSERPTAAVLMHCILLTGQSTSLDIPLWSLVHEARISLVFPLLAFCTLRWPVRTLGVTLAIASPWEYAALQNGTGAWELPLAGWAGAMATSRYLVLFSLGILLAQHRVRLAEFMARLRWPAVVGFVGLAEMLSASPFTTAQGIAAAIVIVIALSRASVARALEWPPIAWLGRVSYSLYLIHVPILLAGWYGVGSGKAITTGSVIVALCAAELMYRLVESPSIALSRRLHHHYVVRRLLRERLADPACLKS